jgi:hypothetical protein
MKIWLLLLQCFVLLSLPISRIASGECASVKTEDDALKTLTARSLTDISKGDQPCISASIDLLAELHSTLDIPLLISYLTYRREDAPGEKEGILLHPRIEGNEYPSVTALAHVGNEARLPLLIVVESDAGSQLEKNNAAHAILLSFLTNSGVAGGIRYFEDAGMAIGPSGRRNLEDALKYLQTVPACTRYKDQCTTTTH